MDHGKSKGVSVIMQKRCLAVLLTLALIVLFVPLPVHASNESNVSDAVEQIKEQLGDVFENMDQETAGELFRFLKEKIAEGKLDSKEGIQDMIEEGEEKFDTQIDEETVKKMVETMEKLEKMGFSAETVIDKAQKLYEDYGADFVDHVDELVKDAVKDAAQNAAESILQNVKNSAKAFFSRISNSFKKKLSSNLKNDWIHSQKSFNNP